MFSKFLEGLSLVIGMCVLMIAVFSDDRRASPARNTPTGKPAAKGAPRHRRAAYLAFGSSLLIYGLVEVVLRGM